MRTQNTQLTGDASAWERISSEVSDTPGGECIQPASPARLPQPEDLQSQPALRYRGRASVAQQLIEPKKLTITWKLIKPNYVSVKLAKANSALSRNEDGRSSADIETLEIGSSDFANNREAAQSRISYYLQNRSNNNIQTVEFLAFAEGRPPLRKRVSNFLSNKDALSDFQVLLNFLVKEIKEKPVKHLQIHMSALDYLWERLTVAKIDGLDQSGTSIKMTKPLQENDLPASPFSESDLLDEEVTFQQLIDLRTQAIQDRAKSLESSPTGGFL